MRYKHKYDDLTLHIIDITQSFQTILVYIEIALMDTNYKLIYSPIEIVEITHQQTISKFLMDWVL